MQQAPFLGYYEEGEALSHDYNYTRYNEYNQEISCDTLTIEVIIVITYATFYRTLLRKNITEYHLIFKEGFSASTLHRMKHGKPITTKTLDSLCDILDCEISDVIERTVE